MVFDIPSSQKVSELVASYKKVAMQEKADRDKTKLSRKHKHFALLVWFLNGASDHLDNEIYC